MNCSKLRRMLVRIQGAASSTYQDIHRLLQCRTRAKGQVSRDNQFFPQPLGVVRQISIKFRPAAGIANFLSIYEFSKIIIIRHNPYFTISNLLFSVKIHIKTDSYWVFAISSEIEQLNDPHIFTYLYILHRLMCRQFSECLYPPVATRRLHYQPAVSLSGLQGPHPLV